MAQEISRKHKLGKTIQNSNYGQGHAWLFEGEGHPSAGTDSELRQLNDINAPIGSKFTDLVEGKSYVKIDSTPSELSGSLKVGAWQIVSGGGSTSIDETQNSDFAPVDAGGTKFLINSGVEVSITINEDSCGIGECIEFKQMGAGQLLLVAGDIVFNANLDTAFKSNGQGSTIKVFHDKVGEYSVGGQTE